jgi:hypothetical protein
VEFYDSCEPERVKKALPAARVQLTTAWTDTRNRWATDNTLSVSIPWGVSFTPTVTNKGYFWARRTYESNTTTTAKFTITTTGTPATWANEQTTSAPWAGPALYPKITMTNELHELIVHSGDKTQSFAANQLPKYTFKIG